MGLSLFGLAPEVSMRDRAARTGGGYADGPCEEASRAEYCGRMRIPVTVVLDAPSVLLAAALAFTSHARPAAAGVSGEDWPRFLGPGGDNTAGDTHVVGRWPAGGLPLVWQREVGSGYVPLGACGSSGPAPPRGRGGGGRMLRGLDGPSHLGARVPQCLRRSVRVAPHR
jgi:hypothetical protein